MMTAIVLPVLIGSAGVAIDYSNMVLQQRQLQEASDSAALAAATALKNGKVTTDAQAQALAKDFVAGQMANYVSDATALKNNTTVAITTTTTATGKNYKVNVKSKYDMSLTPLMSVFGQKTIALASNSSTTSGVSDTKTALSMELVLDQSGSMAYDTSTCSVYKTDRKGNPTTTCKTYVVKIDALKTAAGKLFDALDKADPAHVLVRTGVMSYANGLLRDSSGKIIGISPVNWGTSVGRTYVNTLVANGGTDATEPMQESTKAIQKADDGSDTETKEHAKKGNTVVDRYIVLMTDGEMTGNSNVWNSAKDKNVRDSCDASKKAGIQIFTVAFMAPDKGKSLLQYCASSNSTYFEAETMEDLVDDFDSIAQTATKALTLLTN